MKIVIMATLLNSIICSSQSQSLQLFQQNKMQREYQLEQIAAISEYHNYIHEGYKIMQKGLDAINAAKNTELSLNKSFFRSLKRVNPIIANSRESVHAIDLQISIANTFKDIMRLCGQGNEFNSDELYYIDKTCTNVTTDYLKDLTALYAVTTDDSLQMMDDERMERIYTIYNDLQSKDLFLRHFYNTIEKLSYQRSKERNNILTAQKLYGVDRY